MKRCRGFGPRLLNSALQWGMDQRIDLINRALRPSSIAALMAVGLVFLLGLALIMLYRYAVFGEIDWAGLTAFLAGVLGPAMQHFQNRHDIKVRALHAPQGPSYVNPAALA